MNHMSGYIAGPGSRPAYSEIKSNRRTFKSKRRKIHIPTFAFFEIVEDLMRRKRPEIHLPTFAFDRPMVAVGFGIFLVVVSH